MYIKIKWFFHFFLDKDKNIKGSSTFSYSFAKFHEWGKIMDVMLCCRNHILFHFPFILELGIKSIPEVFTRTDPKNKVPDPIGSCLNIRMGPFLKNPKNLNRIRSIPRTEWVSKHINIYIYNIILNYIYNSINT